MTVGPGVTGVIPQPMEGRRPEFSNEAGAHEAGAEAGGGSSRYGSPWEMSCIYLKPDGEESASDEATETDSDIDVDVDMGMDMALADEDETLDHMGERSLDRPLAMPQRSDTMESASDEATETDEDMDVDSAHTEEVSDVPASGLSMRQSPMSTQAASAVEPVSDEETETDVDTEVDFDQKGESFEINSTDECRLGQSPALPQTSGTAVESSSGEATESGGDMDVYPSQTNEDCKTNAAGESWTGPPLFQALSSKHSSSEESGSEGSTVIDGYIDVTIVRTKEGNNIDRTDARGSGLYRALRQESDSAESGSDKADEDNVSTNADIAQIQEGEDKNPTYDLRRLQPPALPQEFSSMESGSDDATVTDEDMDMDIDIDQVEESGEIHRTKEQGMVASPVVQREPSTSGSPQTDDEELMPEQHHEEQQGKQGKRNPSQEANFIVVSFQFCPFQGHGLSLGMLLTTSYIMRFICFQWKKETRLHLSTYITLFEDDYQVILITGMLISVVEGDLFRRRGRRDERSNCQFPLETEHVG